MRRRDAIRIAAAGPFLAGLLARSDEAAPKHLIWRRPAPAKELLRYGASGRAKQPAPPFEFQEEDPGGTNPKVKVRDAAGDLWIVKWGDEVHSEAFASRLAASAGYFVRTAIYVPEGRIEGVRDLSRASDCVDESGRFEQAVFKLIAPDRPYMAGVNWTWTNNPFLEREQDLQRLNGLKIVMMLTSNWDNKDASMPASGVNTAIYEEKSTRSYLYAFDDWGGTMGRWGNVLGRSKWDAPGYAEQTPELVEGIDDEGFVVWGFDGKKASDLKNGIRLSDIQPLLRRFEGVGPADWKASLEACGATVEETALFADSVVSRFEQLRGLTT